MEISGVQVGLECLGSGREVRTEGRAPGTQHACLGGNSRYLSAVEVSDQIDQPTAQHIIKLRGPVSSTGGSFL